MLRLKHPSRSQPRESAPHWRGNTQSVIPCSLNDLILLCNGLEVSEFLTNLQNNAGGLVKIHHLFNDRLEQLPVAWNAHRCESWHRCGCQLPTVTVTRALRMELGCYNVVQEVSSLWSSMPSLRGTLRQ